MIDQMPDEVWLDEDTINGEFYASPQQSMVTDVRYIRADLYEQVEAERDALRQQAEGWAQEARTQRATVHECYQACTGATGEPGDWHGAEPVRAVVAERDRLRAALESIRDWPEDWQRDGWAIAQEFQGIAEEALDHD